MLRILTVNLYNGSADAASFAAILDELAPDVVAAQELAPDAARVIAERMPFGLLHPALDHSGAGLASASPLAVSRVPLPHRDALMGQMTAADGPINLWSVHLANPLVVRPTTGTRREQVAALEALLAEQVRAGERIVMVGDLNATPIWPAYRRLRRHLADGVSDWAGELGTRPRRTWAYRSSKVPLLRIDHALMSGVRVRWSRTVPVPGSDHRGLVVDVE